MKSDNDVRWCSNVSDALSIDTCNELRCKHCIRSKSINLQIINDWAHQQHQHQHQQNHQKCQPQNSIEKKFLNNNKNIDNVQNTIHNRYSIEMPFPKCTVNSKQRQCHHNQRDNLWKIDFFQLIIMIWFVINQHINLVLSDDRINNNNNKNDIYINSNQLINGNIYVINNTITKVANGFSGSGNDYHVHGGPLNYLVDDDIKQDNHFTSTWAVHVPDGEDAANEVARKHGFTNHGKVSSIFAYFFSSTELIEKTKEEENTDIF